MVQQRAEAVVGVDQGHLEEARGWCEACWAPLSSSFGFLAFIHDACLLPGTPVPTGTTAVTPAAAKPAPMELTFGGELREADSAQLRSETYWGSGPTVFSRFFLGGLF